MNLFIYGLKVAIYTSLALLVLAGCETIRRNNFMDIVVSQVEVGEDHESWIKTAIYEPLPGPPTCGGFSLIDIESLPTHFNRDRIDKDIAKQQNKIYWDCTTKQAERLAVHNLKQEKHQQFLISKNLI